MNDSLIIRLVLIKKCAWDHQKAQIVNLIIINLGKANHFNEQLELNFSNLKVVLWSVVLDFLTSARVTNRGLGGLRKPPDLQPSATCLCWNVGRSDAPCRRCCVGPAMKSLRWGEQHGKHKGSVRASDPGKPGLILAFTQIFRVILILGEIFRPSF